MYHFKKMDEQYPLSEYYEKNAYNILKSNYITTLFIEKIKVIYLMQSRNNLERPTSPCSNGDISHILKLKQDV